VISEDMLNDPDLLFGQFEKIR